MDRLRTTDMEMHGRKIRGAGDALVGSDVPTFRQVKEYARSEEVQRTILQTVNTAVGPFGTPVSVGSFANIEGSSPYVARADHVHKSASEYRALFTTSAAYTLTAGSDWTLRCDTTAAGFTVTLPAAANATGAVFNVKKISSDGNTLTLQAAGSETIDGTNTKTTSTQYASWTVHSNGVGWDLL